MWVAEAERLTERHRNTEERWQKGEINTRAKREKEREVKRSRETEREEGYSKVSIHSLPPQSNPTPPHPPRRTAH